MLTTTAAAIINQLLLMTSLLMTSSVGSLEQGCYRIGLYKTACTPTKYRNVCRNQTHAVQFRDEFRELQVKIEGFKSQLADWKHFLESSASRDHVIGELKFTLNSLKWKVAEFYDEKRRSKELVQDLRREKADLISERETLKQTIEGMKTEHENEKRLAESRMKLIQKQKCRKNSNEKASASALGKFPCAKRSTLKISGDKISSQIEKALKTKKNFPRILCEKRPEENWMIIMRRFDGSVNFDRNFREYRNGFGNLQTEFWIGLDALYELAGDGTTEVSLEINLTTSEGKEYYARYDTFSIGEPTGFVLHVDGYHGNIQSKTQEKQGLEFCNGVRFSTRDFRQGAEDDDCYNHEAGGWWWPKTCGFVGLTNQYTYATDDNLGIYWLTDRITGKYKFQSFKKAEMKIAKYKSRGVDGGGRHHRDEL